MVVHFIGILLFVVVSYNLLYFCGVSCDFSFFISNFIDLRPLLFFSWWVWLKVYQFCLSSQKTNFQFYWSLLLFSSFLFHLFLLWSLWENQYSDFSHCRLVLPICTSYKCSHIVYILFGVWLLSLNIWLWDSSLYCICPFIQVFCKAFFFFLIYLFIFGCVGSSFLCKGFL